MPPEMSTLATRRHQVFPVLEEQEVARITRFGEPRTFEAGEDLAIAGRRSEGVMVILSGAVRVTRKDVVGVEEHIVTYGPRGFLGPRGRRGADKHGPVRHPRSGPPAPDAGPGPRARP